MGNATEGTTDGVGVDNGLSRSVTKPNRDAVRAGQAEAAVISASGHGGPPDKEGSDLLVPDGVGGSRVLLSFLGCSGRAVCV